MGQLGHEHRMVTVQKWGCPTEFLYVYWFFSLPHNNPHKILEYQKTPCLHELFRKVRANFCLLPCEASQETNGNCSAKLVQMNLFILLWWTFRVDFPPVIFSVKHPIVPFKLGCTRRGSYSVKGRVSAF